MDKNSEVFLMKYDEQVYNNALKLREVIFNILPGIIEELDISAKMIACYYGKKYSGMICTIIPSKKGLNQVFIKEMNCLMRTIYLKEQEKFYVMYKLIHRKKFESGVLKQLLKNVLKAYKQRMVR